MPEPSIEKLAAAYINLRNEIEEREEAHKQSMLDIRESFEAVGNAILSFCNDQNLDSVKTKNGTITRRISSRYWTSDWESMHEFIKEHDAFNLLENRIHTGNMKQFLEEHPEEMPMGLQASKKYVVSVRKPTGGTNT